MHAATPIQAIGIEDASFGAINRKTRAYHSELLGVVKLFCELNGVRLFTFKPAEIKSFAVGYGRAEKQQMVDAANLEFKTNFTIDDNDIVDALFVLKLTLHRMLSCRK